MNPPILKKYRLVIVALSVIGLLIVMKGALILADAYGLVGPSETECCATGFDPGPPETPVDPAAAGKL
jgi:hypothetical protein